MRNRAGNSFDKRNWINWALGIEIEEELTDDPIAVNLVFPIKCKENFTSVTTNFEEQ
jgi:hypothetical protein